MPASKEIKPVFPSVKWTLFFLYLPNGTLIESQRFTLRRLKELGRCLLIVCAAPEASSIPLEVRACADALYWKALSGYDFSGYSVGLHAIAEKSPGANVFVLNDSVFGPFENISDWLEAARWDLTGFTGSHQVERHLQSYAFVLRDVSKKRMRHLRSIFPTSYSYDSIMPVVMCFETCFARIAARQMPAGSFWFGPDDGSDPSIDYAVALVGQGFPFLKKALVGKHRGRQDLQAVRSILAKHGLSDES